MMNEISFNLLCAKSTDIAEIQSSYETFSETQDFKIDKINVNNTCYLITAASCCKFETARFLLRKGADPNIVNSLGYSALHCISFMTNIESMSAPDFIKIGKILLRYGANPNLQNMKGQSPLEIACTGSNIELVTLLLINGGDLYIKNNITGVNIHDMVFSGENREMMKAINHHLDVKNASKNLSNDFDNSS